MNRNDMLSRIRAETEPWDLIIIGGGATGVGTAIEAASRGYRRGTAECTRIEGTAAVRETSAYRLVPWNETTVIREE